MVVVAAEDPRLLKLVVCDARAGTPGVKGIGGAGGAGGRGEILLFSFVSLILLKGGAGGSGGRGNFLISIGLVSTSFGLGFANGVLRWLWW